MRLYRVSEAARQDLEAIWSYIAQDNLDAADRFIHALVARFSMLAAQSKLGRSRKELSENLRSHAVGNYVIFYRKTTNGIEIERVLHGAREFPPLFE